jgi:Flp pilus assembly pilin Flp
MTRANRTRRPTVRTFDPRPGSLNDAGVTGVEYGLIVAMIAVMIAGGGALVGSRLSSTYGSSSCALAAAVGQTCASPASPVATPAGDLQAAAGTTTKYTTIDLQRMLGTDPTYSRFWVMDVSAPASSGTAVPATKPDGTRDYSAISYTAPSTPGQYAITLKYNAAPGPPLGSPPVNQPGISHTRTVLIDVH